MLDDAIKEILAGVNRDLVADVEGMDTKYIDPLTEDFTDELFATMRAAYYNFLHNKALAAGYTINATFDKEKGFSERPKGDNEAYRKAMGGLGIGSTLSTRKGKHKGKAGFIVSIPCAYNAQIFASGAAEELGLRRGFSNNDVGMNANESQRKFCVNLFGRETAHECVQPTKVVRATLHDADFILANGPFFDIKKTTNGSEVLEKALREYFMGFSFVSRPLVNNFAYTADIKDDVKLEYRQMPTADQVKNPKDMYSWVLNQRRWAVYFDLFVPEDYARYLTQTPEGEISLPLLTMFWSLWLLGDIGELSAFDAVTAVGSMKNVRMFNKDSRSYKAQLVNGEGLSISSDAYPYFVPETDNIDVYEEEFAQFCMQDDGSAALRSFARLPDNEFTFGETMEDKKANKRVFPKNRIIYTDYHNFRIAYSDSEGLSKTKNIEDWMALSSSDAANILNRKVFIDRTWNKIVLNEMEYVFRNRAEQLGLDFKSFFMQTKEFEKAGIDTHIVQHLAKFVDSSFLGYLDALSTILITNHFPKIRQDDDGTSPLRLEDVRFKHFFNGKVPGLQWLGDALVASAAVIRAMTPEKLQDYMMQRSVENGMRECGIVLALAENGVRQDAVFRADLEDRNAYLNTKSPKKGDHKPRPLPYVQDKDGKGRFLLPHQVRVDGLMENNNPRFVILAADAGGGKTLMVLRDVMSKLESGKLKRPILCMPGNLIRNYIADATYMFGAGLNCIPITSQTLAKYGADRLQQLVLNAPKNTVLLTSYRFISGATEAVFYGTDVMDFNGNLELLRSFNCDGIYCDESHFLRNDSNMTLATRRFAYSIPYRVLATGTLVNKELSDVANQLSIFLPSLFGNKSDFQEEYAESMRGNTVVAWKPGAEAALRRKIAEHCLVIQCKRKEWAALLPNRVENIYVIGDAAFRQTQWYQTYQAILTETVDLIKKDAALVKKLAQADNADDDEEINIEALLRPYLQRLEMFLTAPEKDELGAKVLTGKDRVGPKIGEINRLCREHVSKKIPGKILIFTNYHNSADSIYEHMDPSLKKHTIRYHAENSASDLAAFERDPDKFIMVGTENTLNTGHNLQMASRIIRVESTWTPGNLEQSMARVYRPDPKNMSGIHRADIYLDWVIVNWTIDITKISRLISRVLNKALFDEHDNSAFQDLPNLPVVSMSLESIIGANDFDTTLAEYADGYAQYLEIVRKDLEDYRNDPANELVLTKLERTKNGMEGAALMALCPYSPDQALPKAILDEFKLVRMSDYAREHGDDHEGIEQFDAKDLFVHTERGEGQVVRSTGSTVRVRLRDGSTDTFDKMAVFVIATGKLTDVPVRRKLAQSEALPIHNNLEPSKVDKSVDVKDRTNLRDPKNSIVKKSAPAPAAADKGELAEDPQGTPLALEIYSIYDMLAIDLEDVKPLSKDELETLVGLGFRTGGKYSMCEVPNLQKFDLLLQKMEDNYDVAPANMKVLRDLRKAFTGGKSKLFTAHKAMAMEIKNFWRIQSKPAGKNEIRPYPIVWEGDLHIAVRHFKQPAALTVKQGLRVPGITWDIVEDDYMMFCTDKADVIAKLNKVMKAGFRIKKPKAFAKSLQALRVVKKKAE